MKSIIIEVVRAAQKERRTLPEVGRYTREIDTALLGRHTRTFYDNLKQREAIVLAQLRTGII
jgi:hypothetical protein